MTDRANVAPITEKNAVTIEELMDRVELNLKDRADELARQGRSLRSLGASTTSPRAWSPRSRASTRGTPPSARSTTRPASCCGWG